MDPLTHALSGVLVALAVEPVRPRAGFVGRPVRLATGAVAGLFPDVGYLWRAGDPLAVLGNASGWTHSLLVAPAVALLLAAVFSLIARRPAEWPIFLAITVPALLVHFGLDLMTVSGLQPWFPLSESRYAAPLLFPVDAWLLVFSLLAVAIAWRRPQFARWSALGAFAMGAAYLVTLAHWRDQAVEVGERMARERGMTGYAVQAFPQPFSPRNWQVLVAHGDAFTIAWIQLPRASAAAAASAAASPAPLSASASSATTAAVVSDAQAADDAPQAALPASAESRPVPVPAPSVQPEVAEPVPLPVPSTVFGAVRAGYQSPSNVHWDPSFRFGDDGRRDAFARMAWSRPEFADFRRFSVYTVLSHVEYRADVRQVCAWFYDARFALPNVVPSYRFGSCQHLDDKTWTVRRAPGPLPFL